MSGIHQYHGTKEHIIGLNAQDMMETERSIVQVMCMTKVYIKVVQLLR